MVVMKAENLLQKVATGDRSAFEKLYQNTVKLVFATAYAIIGNRADAEDITSDVFVKVWRKAQSYQGGSVNGWLCAITKNLTLDFIKRRKRESAMCDEFCFGSYVIDEKAEQKSQINDALMALNEDERQTVLLSNAGYKHREIAQITGEPLGTVTWRYQQAIKKMRTFLQGENA